MLLKSKPGRRRDRSGPPALKKLRPDSLLERLDAPADGGLRRFQPLGSSIEIAGLE
ncbi:hypothetical protein ACVII0_000430 [Sinorhizobium meliloti]